MKRTSIAVCLLLAAIPFGRAAQAVPATHDYRYLRDGQVFGTESFTVEQRGDTLVLAGRLEFTRPAPRQLETFTQVVGPEDRLLHYHLRTSRGDSLGVTAADDSLQLFAFTVERSRTERVPIEGRTPVVLDNAVASHLWLLGRQFHRDAAAAASLLALVPQQLWSGPLERGESRAIEATLDGKPLTVTRHRMTIAGLISELDVGPDGEFLALEVPLQSFVIRRVGYDIAPAAPGEPAVVYPAESIAIQGGEFTLGGTLTFPADGEGPFPACVLLQGSGPSDRDMRLGPNRLFKQLADGLAARGIATIRYDKRTLVANQNNQDPRLYMDRGWDLETEVLEDAASAVSLLRTRPEIDPARIFVIGHSLGAAAAPILAKRLAKQDEPLAGLVLMAPPGRDLLSIMIDQYRYLNAMGLTPDEELTRAEHNAERIRDGRVGEDDIILFAKPRYWESVNFWAPWDDYRDQPAPALVLFGERDYQITETDRRTWERTLARDDKPGGELHLLPGRNHLMLPGEGKPGPAEYGLPGEFGEDFLDLVGDWISSQGG